MGNTSSYFINFYYGKICLYLYLYADYDNNDKLCQIITITDGLILYAHDIVYEYGSE
jgi:hypothetical protein